VLSYLFNCHHTTHKVHAKGRVGSWAHVRDGAALCRLRRAFFRYEGPQVVTVLSYQYPAWSCRCTEARHGCGVGLRVKERQSQRPILESARDRSGTVFPVFVIPGTSVPPARLGGSTQYAVSNYLDYLARWNTTESARGIVDMLLHFCQQREQVAYGAAASPSHQVRRQHSQRLLLLPMAFTRRLSGPSPADTCLGT
jgi:hypothetical protein